MATTKAIKQYRYYGDGNSKNTAATTGKTLTDFIDELSNMKTNGISTILQLGVQTLPGTQIFLNATEGDYTTPIVIGATGIYELGSDSSNVINSIQVSPASLANINNTTNAYIIIDILYTS